jgi:diguanylate cyclase (GGDEF)-like protein
MMGYPETMRDVTEQERKEDLRSKRKTLEDHPIIDDVTGLYNESYFHLRLDAEMARAKRYGNHLSLIMLELSRFKKNDATTRTPDGHKYLKIASDIITSCIRHEIDLAFRYSKDTFAIILPEINKPLASNVSQRIQKLIRKEKMEDITIYTGIVQCDDNGHAEEFIKSASDALFKSKQETNRK